MREKQNSAEYQETKQHGSRLFPFNIYPCTIPLDFPVVSLHWHKEMELIYVKGRFNSKLRIMRGIPAIFLW